MLKRFMAMGGDIRIKMTVLVAALGYFVDVFDMYIFAAVRKPSLEYFNLSPEQITDVGVALLNWQMGGMLVGGLFWGIMGDRIGRVKVLFGSILIYSLGNIVNAYAETIPFYAMMRFIVGLGLAGEIGAGITLVSELMSKEQRGYGTTVVAGCGVMGALASAVVSQMASWQNAYIIGGILGLLLLAMRISVCESGMFHDMCAQTHIKRGDILLLFKKKSRLVRYLACIAIAVPLWFVVGVIVTFAPEIGRDLHASEPLSAATAIIYYSIGITLGGIFTGMLSQIFKSRKKVLIGFIASSFIISAVILNADGISAGAYYAMLTVDGFSIGYWTVFLTTTAEQFGTNIRSTATATVPNFVRAAVIPITLSITALKPDLGFLVSSQIVGGVSFILAAIALWYLPETYGKDLDFIEE